MLCVAMYSDSQSLSCQLLIIQQLASLLLTLCLREIAKGYVVQQNEGVN